MTYQKNELKFLTFYECSNNKNNYYYTHMLKNEFYQRATGSYKKSDRSIIFNDHIFIHQDQKAYDLTL